MAMSPLLMQTFSFKIIILLNNIVIVRMLVMVAYIALHRASFTFVIARPYIRRDDVGASSE